MAYYIDTSAATKLVVEEAETAVLMSWLKENTEVVSSDLLRTELLHAVSRHEHDLAPRAREVLGAMDLHTLPSEVFEHAGQLTTATLRSLDAIHLASAMTLGGALEGIVAYDHRLQKAARAAGVNVVAPAPVPQVAATQLAEALPGENASEAGQP